MAAPAVELASEALYADAPAQVLDQQLPLAGDANASSAYGDHEAAAFEDDEHDRQSYPLGQSHTPLTSIPTLGQALLDGNTIDRKYVHSFLQVLADHSQFSDKYQHYEEDEYERKRKRKLRESERKMFFYAGQSVGGASGEKGKSARGKSASSGDSNKSGGANKKRRRKERERERERVLDKEERRQLAGSAPMLPTANSSPSDSSGRSSPFDSSPPTSIPAERASMPNMMPWNDRNAFYSASTASIPSMPSQVQHQHQQLHGVSSVHAASNLMRHRASMPHLPAQQRPTGYLHHSAPLHGNYSSASSFDFVPQTSPLSSSSSSYGYSSSPSPSPSHIVPIKAGDYAPSPPTYHHGQLSQAGHYHHHRHQLQQQQHQQQLHTDQYQHQQTRQSYPQYQQEHVLLEHQSHAGQLHFTAEEQPGELQLDDQWASCSISSSASASAEFSGSESFSSFGPYDPASLGVNAGGSGAANEGLTCADMAAAAASAVEGFMFLQHHHQHHQEESSPEGQQQASAGALGGSVMEDDDWLNSFFDCSVSPLLGGVAGSGGPTGNAGEGQCYPPATGGLDTSHIDSLFADVEAFYGRMVN